jgi:WD40 repeat protein
VSVTVGVVAWYAFQQRDRADANAEQARTESLAATRNQLRAEENQTSADKASGRAVAAAQEALSKERSAYATLNLDANPELSLILARAALQSRDTKAARTALRQALAKSLVQRTYQASGPVRGVAIDLATGDITAGSTAGWVDVWGTSPGAHVRWRAHDGDLRRLTYSPDGNLLATAEDRVVKIWNASAMRRDRGPQSPSWSQRLYNTGTVHSLSFSAHGAYLCAALDGGRAVVWDVRTGRPKELTVPEQGSALAAAFAPVGERVVVGMQGGAIAIWDTSQTEQPPLVLSHEESSSVVDLAFDDAGEKLLSGGADGIVRVWDIPSRTVATTLVGHTGTVTAVAFMPHANAAVSGGADRTIRVWDLASGQEFAQLRGHAAQITHLAVAAGSADLVSGSEDGTVRVWSIRTLLARSELKALQLGGAHDGGLTSIDFSTDGKLAATAGWDGSARVWDLDSGHEMATITQFKGVPFHISFLPGTSDLVVTASNQLERPRIWAWQESTVQPIGVLSGEQDYIFSVGSARMPDGYVVASATHGGIIHVWRVPAGTRRADRRGEYMPERGSLKATNEVMRVAISRGAHYLATASFDRSRVELFDLHRMKKLWIVPRDGSGSEMYAVSFSPDERYLATASGDYVVRLWKIASQVPMVKMQGHTQAVRSIAFHPSGSLSRPVRTTAQLGYGTLKRGCRYRSLAGTAARLR